jgi:hypothetical protein
MELMTALLFGAAPAGPVTFVAVATSIREARVT